MTERECPEGYKAVYFMLGTDSFDDTITLVQIDEEGEQVATEIEWDTKAEIMEGVLYVPEHWGKKKNFVELILDVKPQQATINTYTPDVKPDNKFTQEYGSDFIIKNDGKGNVTMGRPDDSNEDVRMITDNDKTIPVPVSTPFHEALDKAMKTDVWSIWKHLQERK